VIRVKLLYGVKRRPGRSCATQSVSLWAMPDLKRRPRCRGGRRYLLTGRVDIFSRVRRRRVAVCARNRECEGGTRPVVCCCPHSTIVGFNNRAANREPHAHTFLLGYSKSWSATSGSKPTPESCTERRTCSPSDSVFNNNCFAQFSTLFMASDALRRRLRITC